MEREEEGGEFEKSSERENPLPPVVLGSSLLKKEEEFRKSRRVISFRAL